MTSSFAFGLAQNPFVVDAGIDPCAMTNVRLVLFTLFDSAFVPVEVLHDREALHGLHGQIAVGHGVADDHGLAAQLAQPVSDHARHRTLAAPVRTAQPETTGRCDATCVCSALNSQKSAPAAPAREARCIRF